VKTVAPRTPSSLLQATPRHATPRHATPHHTTHLAPRCPARPARTPAGPRQPAPKAPSLPRADILPPSAPARASHPWPWPAAAGGRHQPPTCGPHPTAFAVRSRTAPLSFYAAWDWQAHRSYTNSEEDPYMRDSARHAFEVGQVSPGRGGARVHACMRARLHARACVLVRTRVHVCAPTCMSACACVHTCMRARSHARACACACARVHPHMHERMRLRAHLHACMHTRAHARTPACAHARRVPLAAAVPAEGDSSYGGSSS